MCVFTKHMYILRHVRLDMNTMFVGMYIFTYQYIRTTNFCSTLRHTAADYNTVQPTTAHCKNCNTRTMSWSWPTKQHSRHIAVHYNLLQHAATHCNKLKDELSSIQTNLDEHTATHCTTLQHTATHCNTLHHTWFVSCARKSVDRQHAASHCNTL